MVDSLSPGFRVRRRVQYYETDLAGIVHFSWYFRYMEEAEHALWRAAGMSIDRPGGDLGWPRVSASFDFQNPLYFEDEFETIVRLAAMTRRTIQYAFELRRGDMPIGAGSLTAACVRKGPDTPMRAVEIPADILTRLRGAAGQTA